MKNLLIVLSCLIIAFTACEQSEGTKFGVLQKVSHKKYPCEYYEIQVAYKSGVMQSADDGKSSSYSNAQDFQVTKEAADSLVNYVGDAIIFEYKDDGFKTCGSSKVVTSIKIKK